MEWPAHLPIVGGGGVTVMDAGVAPGTTSIAKSISLCGGNPSNSSGNMSEKSLTVRISNTLGLAFTVSIT